MRLTQLTVWGSLLRGCVMSVTAFVILYLSLGLAWAWHCAWVRQPVYQSHAAMPVGFRVLAWPVDALCDWVSLEPCEERDG